MRNDFSHIGKWFSPRFLAWLRAFLLFFVIYTLFALLLRYTIGYTIPFLIGLGIAMMSQPLIRLSVKRLHLKESLSVWLSPLLTIIILLGIIGSVGFLAIRELFGLMRRIPQINPQAILTAVENWLIGLELPFAMPVLDMDYAVAFLSDNRDPILRGLTQALSFAGMVAGWAISFVTSLPTWLMLFIVIIFSAFTFTKNFKKLKGFTRSLFSEAAIHSGRQTWADGLLMLGRYIRSYLLIYFLTFLQTYILFLFLDIDYPLTWSALVGISDIIPILGPGTIYLPMAVLHAVEGDWKIAVMLMVGWLFVTVVRQFVESKVVADSINIHPLFMLAILFIAFQAGSVSLLIYLTFLIVFYNLLKHSGMLRPLFVSHDEAPPPKKRLRIPRLLRPKPDGTSDAAAKMPPPDVPDAPHTASPEPAAPSDDASPLPGSQTIRPSPVQPETTPDDPKEAQ